MKLGDLVSPQEAFGSHVPQETEVTGICQNASDVKRGEVFFAIKGTQQDGHAFIAEALKRGASAIVIDRPELFSVYARTIMVPYSRMALAKAASRWHREPSKWLKLVGLTGTNGKTTSAYLLEAVWKACGLTSGLVSTVESHIGNRTIPSKLTTPDPVQLQKLLLEMVEEGITNAVMEVTSIALDQHRIGGCTFDIVLFSNLTQDHLDYHRDFEAYYEAKLRLFQDYPARMAVINIDDPYGRRLSEESTVEKRLTYSLIDPTSHFYAKLLSVSKSGSEAILKTPAGEYRLCTPLIGSHNVYNCLGVVAIAWAQHLEMERVMKALETAQGAPGRLERVAASLKHPYVFVDFAHTDDALRNVLSSLRPLRGNGRLVTVFGCGGDRDRGKRPKMGKIASQFSDVTIATSDNPRTENPEAILDDIEPGIEQDHTQYHREANRKKAIDLALQLAKPEDLVVIAGKGHETYQIVGTQTYPFDDRQVVREYYSH